MEDKDKIDNTVEKGDTKEFFIQDVLLQEADESLPAINDVLYETDIFNQDLSEKDIYGQDKSVDMEGEIVKDISSLFAEQTDSEYSSENKANDTKSSKTLIIISTILGVLILIVLFLVATKPGRKIILGIAASYVESKVVYDDGSNQDIIDIEDDIDITEDDVNNQDLNIISDDDIDLNTDDIEVAEIKEIINILILGEETIESGTSRGRTDLIMIASVNVVNKSYTLISLMRDMYVSIPGHQDNKLNAAYQIGGIQLLYETIEKNFKLNLDGYCLVRFDDFETIIDKLGGLNLMLSSKEAQYLKTTNYISNPNFRNVSAGIQLMNGNQVLGYCRVRHVPTSYEADDFGRTKRHRIVINAISEKIKEMDYINLLKLLNSVLPYITTDLDSSEIADYMETVLEIGITPFIELRIPAEGTYESGYVRQMYVLLPNLADNINLIHNTISGIY